MKKLNKWDFENFFYHTSDKSRLRKIIDHYEIYKKIKDVNGDIYEFGVFKGVSLIRFLTFRDIFNSNKHVYGFDAFGKFPTPQTNSVHKKRDTNFARFHDQSIGFGFEEKKINQILKKKKFKKFTLIKGDVQKTIISFLKKKRKKIKISLLHLDLDIFFPTKFVLEHFYEFISKKGIILIDDYSHIQGATMAIDEFLKDKPFLKLEKLSSKSRPSFIIKK